MHIVFKLAVYSLFPAVFLAILRHRLRQRFRWKIRGPYNLSLLWGHWQQTSKPYAYDFHARFYQKYSKVARIYGAQIYPTPITFSLNTPPVVPQLAILATLASLSLFSGSAVAQITYAPCNSSVYNWTFNSLSQNPCAVSAYLQGTCNQGAFSQGTLAPGEEYSGPDGVDDSNLCKCNTVTYSLVSACGACQELDWITWSEWVTNCTKVFPISSFPNPVPNGTYVPQWALLDVSLENSWNPNKSMSTGDTPEIPPGVLIGSSSTTSGTSTSTAAPAESTSSTPAASPASKGKSSSAGPIGGGVGGGIGVIAAVLGIFYLRRRRAGPKDAAPSEDAESPAFDRELLSAMIRVAAGSPALSDTSTT